MLFPIALLQDQGSAAYWNEYNIAGVGGPADMLLLVLTRNADERAVTSAKDRSGSDGTGTPLFIQPSLW